MRPAIDPLHLTPHQRFREVAALLAASLLRLRRGAILPALAAEPPGHEKPEESEAVGLELRRETRLSVPKG